MKGFIREKTGIDIKNVLLKYDGRPFDPEEIYAKAKEVMSR
jgi:pyruvate/2-oxoacid:ferredoxin oxidoreductase alpha subunit